MKVARKLGDGYAFRKRHRSHFDPSPLAPCAYHEPWSHAYWECYVRHMATTDHHPVGTCAMGSDYDHYAVLDAKFRVRGAKGLRVVDGSAMPDLVTGNINIPIIMMAERAADFIKREYLYSSHHHHSVNSTSHYPRR